MSNGFDATVEDIDLGYDEFAEDFAEGEGGVFVDIGMLREDFSEDDVATKGVQNEFGAVVKATAADGSTFTVRIPARPHHRTAFDAAYKGYLKRLQRELARPTNMDFKDALEDIGREHKAFLQKLIEDYTNPPNKASTVRKKGFDDPLYETGSMLRGIDWRVHDDRDL